MIWIFNLFFTLLVANASKGEDRYKHYNHRETKKLVDWIKENKAEEFYVDCGQIDSFSMSSESGGSLMALPSIKQDGCILRKIKMKDDQK